MTLNEAFVSKRNNFSLVRLAAAMAVVISHAYYISSGADLDEPLLTVTGLSLGQHAVNVFFGLSGFLILASWERHPDAIRFILARILRIVPGLAAAACATMLAGMLLTQLPLAAYADAAKLGSYLFRVAVLFDAHATLPGVFEDGAPTNIVLMTIWTLKYEMAAYLGVLLLGLSALNRKPAIHVALVAGFVLAEVLLAAHADFAAANLPLGHTIRFGFCFAIGMAAWRFRAGVPLDARLFGLAVAVLVAAGVFGGVPRPLLYVAEIYGALWIALSQSLPVASWLEGTDLSYGIYLYGWPAEQALHIVFPEWSVTALVLASLVASGMLAALSWTWIERPSLAALPIVKSLLGQILRDVPPSAAAYEAEDEQQDDRTDCGHQQALPETVEAIAKLVR